LNTHVINTRMHMPQICYLLLKLPIICNYKQLRYRVGQMIGYEKQNQYQIPLILTMLRTMTKKETGIINPSIKVSSSQKATIFSLFYEIGT